MRILLDQNLPRALRTLLPGHDVRTAAEMGWSTLVNGVLVDAAERGGFEAIITADKNFRFPGQYQFPKSCGGYSFDKSLADPSAWRSSYFAGIARRAAGILSPGSGRAISPRPFRSSPKPVRRSAPTGLEPGSKVSVVNHRQQRTAFEPDTGGSAVAAGTDLHAQSGHVREGS
jgi:hypothetical protein